ncbi:MAG: hypothetical protein WB760_19630 [Xanthobacteraceae bacterium]
MDVVLLNPLRMTPKRFRIYHLDIGGKPGIFQGAFATTAEAIAFSCKPEEEYRILVDHKKSYSVAEFKAFAAENKFDNGGRP